MKIMVTYYYHRLICIVRQFNQLVSHSYVVRKGAFSIWLQVIPNQFEDFKFGIKQLLLNEFFA